MRISFSSFANVGAEDRYAPKESPLSVEEVTVAVQPPGSERLSALVNAPVIY